jgi:hypothetical protein
VSQKHDTAKGCLFVPAVSECRLQSLKEMVGHKPTLCVKQVQFFDSETRPQILPESAGDILEL